MPPRRKKNSDSPVNERKKIDDAHSMDYNSIDDIVNRAHKVVKDAKATVKKMKEDHDEKVNCDILISSMERELTEMGKKKDGDYVNNLQSELSKLHLIETFANQVETLRSGK